MAGKLVFYTNPMSRGRIVRWMLEEVGTPYETEIMEYGGNLKSPEYLAINPMGKVPAIRHGDAIVTEAAAICAYLADAFPGAGLAPPPDARAAYYRWMFFAAGPIEAAVTNEAFGVELTDEQRATAGYGSLPAVLDTLQGQLALGPFITGETFTAADVYVGSEIAWGMMFGTIEARPGFAEYVERLTSRDAARRAREIDDALMPAREG